MFRARTTIAATTTTIVCVAAVAVGHAMTLAVYMAKGDGNSDHDSENDNNGDYVSNFGYDAQTSYEHFADDDRHGFVNDVSMNANEPMMQHACNSANACAITSHASA